MGNYTELIRKKAVDSNARILLPESTDHRVQKAAAEMEDMGFTLLEVENYRENSDKYFEYIKRKSFTNHWPDDNIRLYLENPLHFALVMVAMDDADCLIAGAATASSEVIRSAIRIVGIAPESKWVSSIFFMVSPEGNLGYTFADCAVIPEPDSKQLAAIAAESAGFHHLLTNEIPKVAFLSFSTKGSADHYRVDRVKEAVNLFSKKNAEILHDGELQFDAAFNRDVSSSKAPESPLMGEANVFIFPNLDAGNIAYKITQYLAGYSAWGPLLQGLNKPVHDLSRGCSVVDIINVASVAAIQRTHYANL